MRSSPQACVAVARVSPGHGLKTKLVTTFSLSYVATTWYFLCIDRCRYNSPSPKMPFLPEFNSPKCASAASACVTLMNGRATSCRSRRLSPCIARPPQARSNARNAKWPPTTGLAMNHSPGNPPSPSVSYRSVNGRSAMFVNKCSNNSNGYPYRLPSRLPKELHVARSLLLCSSLPRPPQKIPSRSSYIDVGYLREAHTSAARSDTSRSASCTPFLE